MKLFSVFIFSVLCGFFAVLAFLLDDYELVCGLISVLSGMLPIIIGSGNGSEKSVSQTMTAGKNSKCIQVQGDCNIVTVKDD